MTYNAGKKKNDGSIQEDSRSSVSSRQRKAGLQNILTETDADNTGATDLSADTKHDSQESGSSFLSVVKGFFTRGDVSGNEIMAATQEPVRAGVWLFILLFILGGGWAAFAKIDSAAVAQGVVVLNENKKVIQHLEGGIIKEILVEEGESVVAGQSLVLMDETKAKATRGIIRSQLLMTKASEYRLLAERDNQEIILFDDPIFQDLEDPEVKKALDSQQRLFSTRRNALNGQVAILNQRVEQLADEIEGLEAQEGSARKQLELIGEEVEIVSSLLEKGSALRPRLLALQRQAAELEGKIGEYLALIARAGQGIAENEMSIINLKNEHLRDVVAELRENQAQISDLEERLTAANDVLDRIVIIAPQSGVVTGLKFHTVGGVVGPGAELLNIIPQDDELIIEAKILPQDIDVVHSGLDARVRLTAFKVRNVPVIEGKVIHVSPDRFVDQYTGHPYYLARVRISNEVLDDLAEKVELYPGMPADVLVVIGARTPLQYLVDPIMGAMHKAWKEQ